MKATEIRDLIDFIAQSGLAEVNIESEDFKISVKRNTPVTVTEAPAATVVTAAPAPVATPAASPAPAAESNTASNENVAVDTSNLVPIKSPMIGTFYRASSPENPPLVSVGDKVTAGQAVCIIEAMKLFNEIESDVSGTIVQVMAENSTPVEYDQPLFMVQPD